MFDNNLACSFCGLDSLQVKHLIKGLNAFICDDCVASAAAVIEEGRAQKAAQKTVRRRNTTPELIVKHLDEYVIGQPKAKKALAIALHNHQKRINGKVIPEVQKSNVMLIGPTGSGKTFTVSTLAKYFDVPFVSVDATTITEAGYVGDDADMIIGRLLAAAGGDVKLAERGIALIDEVDKIAARPGGNGRDIRGEGVQQALLKMVEGGKVLVNSEGGKKNPNSKLVEVDTTNILFIFSGAFSAMTDKTNNKKPRAMGLGKAQEAIEEKPKDLVHQDLVRFGMIPEFMGRIPVITQLEGLSEDDLLRVLREPKNALVRQYASIFEADGIEAEFTDGFLREVAKRAIEEGTGARGLRTIMEEALFECQYKLPGKKVKKIKLTEDVFNSADLPIVETDPVKPDNE